MQTPTSDTEVPVVFIVDDDPSVRAALALLMGSAGWRAEAFASAAEFLAGRTTGAPSCLVLDIAMPDVDGLELQRRVAAARPEMPIIFVTGHGDVPKTVQAMKAGAVEFLTKPFEPAVLVGAVAAALERSRHTLDQEARISGLRERYASLSSREREVMALVVAGLLNKQVGDRLHISEVTVKAHRGQVMRKMDAASLAALVTMSALLGLKGPADERQGH